MFTNRNKLLALALGTLLSIFAFQPALAAQEDVQKLWETSGYAYPGKGMRTMKIMHMMDTDNDGKVTKEEFMAFQYKVWHILDKDHKGYITQEEWMAQELKKPGG